MAKTPRFVEFGELSQDLREFIQAGAKIFPIDTFEDLPSTKDKEYYRILSGSHKNEIYAWSNSDGSYVLIGGEKNSDITKAEIEAKLTGTISSHTHASGTPTAHAATHATGGEDAITPADIGAATSGHLHTKSQITDFAHTHTLSDITDKGNLASINTNSSTSNFLRGDGTWVTPPNTTYSAMSVAEGLTGTATSSRAMRADYLKQIIQHYAPTIVSVLPTTNLHSGMTFYKEV